MKPPLAPLPPRRKRRENTVCGAVHPQEFCPGCKSRRQRGRDEFNEEVDGGVSKGKRGVSPLARSSGGGRGHERGRGRMRGGVNWSIGLYRRCGCRCGCCGRVVGGFDAEDEVGSLGEPFAGRGPHGGWVDELERILREFFFILSDRPRDLAEGVHFIVVEMFQ